MADIDTLRQAGEKLGLSGQELLDFIRDEREREERMQKELFEREKFEREKQEHFEKEKLEREERLEKERRERDERAHEREMRKLEIEREIEIERARSGINRRVGEREGKAKLPKLPNFNDKQDNIDAYLRRFERFAENAKWEKENWASHLSALLTGTALDVYSRMPVADAENYDVLKENLLKRFKLTEEGFREKFRKSTSENGETACQFVVRLGDYLDNWMAQAQVGKDYKGLRDLMLREQFLQSSAKGLQLFLKERRFESVQEMAASADRYLEAHDLNQGSLVRKSLNGRVTETGRKQFESYRGKSCFACSGPHLIKDCPKRKESAAALYQQNGRYERNDFKQESNRSNWRWNKNHEGSFDRNGYKREEGKYSRDKPKNMSACCVSHDKVVLNCGHELPVMSVACNDQRPSNMPEYYGKVGTKSATVLRDTGCSTVVVKKSLVELQEFTGDTQMCVLIDGTVRKFPTAIISVSSPFFKGKVKAMCMETPVYDLIIGNVDGVYDIVEEDVIEIDNIKDLNVQDTVEGTKELVEKVAGVQTRAQAKNELAKPKPMKVPSIIDFEDIGPKSLIKLQNEDQSLATARELAESGETKMSGKLNSYKYSKKNRIIFREFSSPKHQNGRKLKQLVLPTKYRTAVLKTAHESLFGGHLGVQKTTDKVLAQFHWPGILADVKRYCSSCDICQRTISKGKVSKVPLVEMPIIKQPFQRVAVDLIGPIAPASERNFRYILTVVDYATRYPEAVALKNIETETVSEALIEIFSRVGVPREILSDQGTQFTSGLMKEVGRLLSLKQLTTTPYHAQCNGLVEKFNGTLKSIIKKLCCERPRDWDKFIGPALFAYREAPQASTGFSPFELLYGRTVRGPLMIIKELMRKDLENNDTKTTYHYVVDLRERLEETLKLATEELKKSQVRYKKNFDQRARARDLKAGDKALVLLPTNHNKLLMQWQGPFEVVEKVGQVNYKLKLRDKERIYHANMLKRYQERDKVDVSVVVKEMSNNEDKQRNLDVDKEER